MKTTETTLELDQVVRLLEKVEIFQGLPRADLERIAQLVSGREVQPGELLFREGDPGDKFYIVFNGSLEILKERPRGDHERLAVKRAGEAFGEMSLLTDAPRSASVRALEKSQLMVVSRDQFDQLLGGESLAVRLMRGLARALRALDVRFAAREAAAGGGLAEFSRKIQEGLLPREVPQIPGYEIGAALIPAGADPTGESRVGDTVWDISMTEQGPLVSIYEVKGTGFPPGYLLALARALVRQVSRSQDDLGELIGEVNTAIGENMLQALDECVEVGLLHIREDGTMLSIAGEQPGIVLRANGDVEELGSHGPPLGILPSFQYSSSDLKLAEGDTLIIFSEADGGLLRGVGDLVKQRSSEPIGKLVGMLRTALEKVDQVRNSKQDVAFVLVRRT